MKNLLPFLAFLFLTLASFAQKEDIAIGQWRSYLSYNNGINLAEVGDKIYCATDNGLYYYNRADNSVKGLSTVDGFSDVKISIMRYDPDHKLMIIGYNDLLLDFFYDDKKIEKVEDMQELRIQGEKKIYDIYFNGDRAWFSTSFGIVYYDLAIKEWGETYDTYNPTDSGSNITRTYGMVIHGDSIYAATDSGIMVANKNEFFLKDYNSWKRLIPGKCTHIAAHDDALYAAIKGHIIVYQDGKIKQLIDSVGADDAKNIRVTGGKVYLTTNNGIYELTPFSASIILKGYNVTDFLVAGGQKYAPAYDYGMVKINPDGDEVIQPVAPLRSDAYAVTHSQGQLWVLGGGMSFNGGNLYSASGFYLYLKEYNYWYSFNPTDGEFQDEIDDGTRDFLDAAVDPISKDVFVTTYSKGVIRANLSGVKDVYNAQNSSLQYVSAIGDSGFVRTVDAEFDKNGNLWVTNPYCSRSLSVRKKNGEWVSYNLDNEDLVFQIVIDGADQKWITTGPHTGLMVFNDNGTIDNTADDKLKKLDQAPGNGNLPTLAIYSMAIDKDGELWLGTDDGIAVIFDPTAVFTGGNFDAQQIFVGTGSDQGVLLLGQTILAIKVDGANRKWIATTNGVYLTKPDGNEILLHFTTKNSPLLSNEVFDIDIDDKTGEVFFATTKGLISFRGTAIEGHESFTDVYVFPNPVRPQYNGPIAIKGLVANSVVKITDASGNLVYEMYSDGGQAVWNGKNFKGEDVVSGVYFVMSASEDGTQNSITKLLIIR